MQLTSQFPIWQNIMRTLSFGAMVRDRRPYFKFQSGTNSIFYLYFLILEYVLAASKNDKIPLLTFWKGICGNLPLSKIAIAILSMSPTSAASERSFSAQGAIHTKSRNKLTTNRSFALNYVNMNLKFLEPSKKKKKKSKKKNLGK